jgi:hypothetical protein
MIASDIEFVAGRIAARYAHPGRTAYTYLFQLKPDSDFGPLVPDPESVIVAWMDEGNGLLPAPTDTAVEHCRAVLANKTDLTTPRKITSHERRQMMARSILFTVTQPADLVEVRLLSRALVFSPKGDREANEQWRPTGEGWYSAYRSGQDDD